MQLMLLRGLVFVIAIASSASAVRGQAHRVDTRPHPPQTARVLSAHPSERQAVYASDEGLIFEFDAGIQTVRFDGALLSTRASSSGAFAAALVRSQRTLDLQVYAADGRVNSSWTIAHHRDDRLPRAAVSDADGGVVYALPSTAELCFAAAESAEPRCTMLFKDAPHDTEREVLVDYSPDGRLIAVAAQREASRPGLPDAAANTHVFLFDRNGSLLWTTTLPEPGLRSLAFSPSSGLAVSTYDAYAPPESIHATHLLSADGSRLATAPFGAHAFAFRGSETLLQSPRALALLDGDGGSSRIIFRPESGSQIVAIDTDALSDAGETAVLTGRTVLTENGFAFDALRLVHLNGSGDVAATVDLDVPPQIAPRVRLDANTTAVVLDHATEFYAR